MYKTHNGKKQADGSYNVPVPVLEQMQRQRESKIERCKLLYSKKTDESGNHRQASTPKNSSSIFMLGALASVQSRKCAVEAAANSASRVT